MKSFILAGALAAASLLAGTASGRPINDKRDLTTEVVFVTTTVANVIVYVDENGEPFSTTTQVEALSTVPAIVVPSTTAEATLAPTTSADIVSDLPPLTFDPATPEATPVPTTSVDTVSDLPPLTFDTATSEVFTTPVATPEISAFPVVSSQEPEPTTSTTSSLLATSSASEPAVSAIKQDASPSSFPIGITYDPFEGPQDQARCKTEAEISDEFGRMKEFKIVRIYGMGCNIVPLAVQNAVKNGQQLMAGAYMSTKGNGEDLSSVIQTLKDAVDKYAGGNWNIIQLFAVENERVNDHDMTASAVVDAINRARGQLRGLGYNGPVSAVETVPAMVNNPMICKASDVTTVNSHAFFDVNTKAADAGTFVKGQVEQVKKACGTNRVIVTESGWPHRGDPNGDAVPSPDNQRAAVKSLRDNFNSDMFLFNAFDSTWKSDWASSFNAERYWGVMQ